MISFSKPAPEVLNEYSRKVDFLKGMLEAEKLVRCFCLLGQGEYQILAYALPSSVSLEGHIPCPFFSQSSSSEKALANQFLAPGRTPTTTKERIPATQTVHLQTKARYTGEMRSELLGTVCLLAIPATPYSQTGPFKGPQAQVEAPTPTP